MNNVLVEIYLPAAAHSFDVFIPCHRALREVTPLAAKILSDLSGGLFAANGSAVLCERDSGAIFDINMTAAELGIRNGSALMLI